jgi:hypothetical protein
MLDLSNSLIRRRVMRVMISKMRHLRTARMKGKKAWNP